MTLSITALFVNIKLLSFDEMDKVKASVVINSYVITCHCVSMDDIQGLLG